MSIINIDTNSINFSVENYNSNNGMFPSVWGPLMWHFLHIISFNYPTNPDKKTKKHYYNFIINLQYILPCSVCRLNLKKNLKNFSIKHMKNRYTFSKFIYNLHDTINKLLNKPPSPDYYDIRNFYECFRAKCPSSSKKKTEKGCHNPKYNKKYKCSINMIEKN